MHQAGEGETFFVHRLDLAHVHRVRAEGTMGIAQTWKQLRDSGMRPPTPTYQDGASTARCSGRLGPLRTSGDA